MAKMILGYRAAVLFFASLLLMSRSGQAPAQGKNAIQASVERGGKVYYQQCLSCHQADGGGVQSMNPPLTRTKWVLGDRTQLIQIVLNGMTLKTEINGDTYHNVMASHSDLSDQQIADVLTYVRNSFGNKAGAITMAQVKAVRAKAK
jgi:mono/diheme cytochrome c family protein